MSEIISAIKDWPVIVQGAIGSGLFWIILLLCQKTADYLSRKYSQHSNYSRESWLINRHTMIQLVLSESLEEKGSYASILLYRSSRYLFKAIMWLALGLVLQIFYTLAALIGFIGCLYYLFKGYYVVGGANQSNDELEKEREKIHMELVNMGHFDK